MWWHGWTRENLQELAGTLMVGHLIECGTYATGGYYSGFKSFGANNYDLGCEFAPLEKYVFPEFSKIPLHPSTTKARQ